MPTLKSSALHIATFLLLTHSAGAATVHHPRPPSGEYTSKRRIEYSFTLDNRSADPGSNIEFVAFTPNAQAGIYECLTVESSESSELTTDELGNQYLRFKFDTVPPFGKKIIHVRAELGVNKTPKPALLDSPERYLNPEPLIESEDPNIKKLAAATLSQSNPEKSARRVFDWIGNNLRYSGYLGDARGAAYALKHRAGDCTEYASLFVAFCRAVGIPARVVSGFVQAEGGVLSQADYHDWAEIRLGDAWRTVDPQRGRFLEKEDEYLAFVIHGSGEGNSLKSTYRYRVNNRQVVMVAE